MKTVYLITLDNISQASIVKDVLLNEGIESFTKNEMISSVLNIPNLQLELEVFEEDYEKAYEILKQGFPELIDGIK